MNGIGLWLLISVFAGFVNSCGVTTHNVVAHRALEWFLPEEYAQYKEIINRNQGAFQNGAAFPDWGYDCFLKPLYPSLQDASEEAHWPPFQMATADYIRDNYPQPWSPDAEKLVAFLFGFVAHGVSDIIWHDLEYVGKTRQGFIQALANSNFNNHNLGYGGDAHNEADTGGEFMAAYEVDLSFIEWDWEIPSADLAKIYHSLNFTEVSSQVIESCNAELYAEVQAIARLPSELIYPHFAAEASFLVDQYQDWWMGGLNDMSIWTEWCWPYIINWVENGSNNRTSTDICIVESLYDPPVSAALSEYRKLHTKAEISARKNTKKALLELVGEMPKVEIVHEGNIAYFRLAERDQYQSNVIEKRQEDSNMKDFNCIGQEDTEASVEFYTEFSYSLLGHSLAHGDLNNDGFEDIVMGAPGFNVSTGRVYISYGSSSPITGHSTVNVETCTSCDIVTISPPEQKQGIRFGYNVKTLDLNLDGNLDLVVSAPSYNADLYYYTGIVYVYYGGNGKDYGKPDLTIYTPENYTNLGVHMHTSDVNGDGNLDLILGNPFAYNFTSINETIIDLYEAGNIWIFFSSQEMKKSGILTQDDADAVLGLNNVDDLWGWHGFHTDVATVGAKRYLLASQTMFNNGTMPIGKLIAYDVTSWKYGVNRNPPIAFEILGSSYDSHLGYHFSHGTVFGKSAIALSFSTYNTYSTESHPQAGAVYLISLEGLSGSYFMDDTEITSRVLSTIFGDEEFARLGAVVKLSDLDGDGTDDLFITEPYRDSTAGGGDAGGFYIWRSARIPRGETPHPKESSSLCMHSVFKKSLYGFSGLPLDINADKKSDILIAGPRDQKYAMNAGTVTLMMNVLSL